MFNNYFKLALRSLFKNKGYSIINITGLTFGLACFLIIGLYLFDELTFDQQHINTDRIYRVIEHRQSNSENLTIASTSYNLAEQSVKKIAEVENTARFTRSGRANIENPENKNVFQETVTYADNGLMEIFDFEALDGDTKSALIEPNSIVIVEDLAQRLFHQVKVAGRMIKWEFMDQPLKITAVIKNHPPNSSFDFNSVYSISTHLSDTSFARRSAGDWSSDNYMVFALLKKNANPETAAFKMTDMVNANLTLAIGESRSLSLQPLKDMHLKSDNIWDGARNANVAALAHGSYFYINIFALVAFFVLFIACINYMNLTTAKASNRSKEIGVRKSSGAYRSQLIYQFLLEAVIISLISFVLSILLVNLMLPSFNLFVNKGLHLDFHTDYRIWLYAVSATIITGFISGSYPALILSGFSPIVLLKNLKIQHKNDLSVRKGLVIFQFTVSVIMIIATMVLFLQVRYLSHKDLGFNKELLVVVDINSYSVRRDATTIISEFSKIPTVKNVSTTSRVPGEWKDIPTVKVRQEGNTDIPNEAYFLGVDENFANTFEIKLLNGRNFMGPGDTSSILLNEVAADMLHIKEATGQFVEIPERAFGGSYFPLSRNVTLKAKIIGIVKDFNFQTLREPVAPLVIGYKYNPVHNIDYYTSRIDATGITTTLQKMEDIIHKIDAHHLFEYHFLDQQLALFYVEDARRQKMLIWAALATLFIACMGLFGLATFAAEQRIKEIGIRKVLGASVSNITSLLSRDFIKLVVISILIACPIAYFLMDIWLHDFAYRVEIYWWIFIVAGVVAVLIALFTISFQAIRAAIANPIKSLRTE